MSRRHALLAVVAAATVLASQPALGHATISRTSVQPGERLDLTVQSIVEREALINKEMRILVPRQWKTLGCKAPTTWSCRVDRIAYKPHALVTYQAAAVATPLDVDFTVTVEAPRAPGTYLFRALQTHADGWVEPWVYQDEPYVAPRVQVGSSTRIINPDNSREDPPCFGPVRQPATYSAHDGRPGSCSR